MLRASSALRRAAATHCHLCGSALSKQAGTTAARALSSQTTASSLSAHGPGWLLHSGSKQAPHWRAATGSNVSSLLRRSAIVCGGRRAYATIIEVPTAAEDDLPEPALRQGEESASTTFEVTPAAAKRLSAIQARENDPNLALRILVESGGCHGYSTKLQVADAVKDRQEDDYLLSAKSDAASGNAGLLLVDAITLSLIKGSTLDYATELIGSSFRLVDNPQAKGAGCGCGVSWELKI